MREVLSGIYHSLKRAQAKHVYKNANLKPLGYDRMYHVHIRKSAGTSVNSAFWSKANFRLDNVGRKTILIGNNLVLVRNNKKAAEAGHYYYANAHHPYWSVNLPKNTYTFCVLRDPLQRLVSLYNYYRWILELDPSTATAQEPYYKSLIFESSCAKNGFDSFLRNAPKENLVNQLFTFSEKFDVEEAKERCSGLSNVYFQDRFSEMIDSLSEVAGFELEVKNERKSRPSVKFEISDVQKEFALDLLKDEYVFYNAMRDKFLL